MATQILDFLVEMVAAPAVGAAVAWWLTKTFLKHRLTVGLEKLKADFQNELASHRAEAEGEVKKQVEKILADEAADRQYNQEAKRRLYSAVGPLRFQLLLACRDLSNRVSGHGRKNYKFDMDHYYARSFLYRVARPLALFELIERQMSQADFSVDPIGKQLLEYHSSASNIFCGSDIVGDHSKKDMSVEREHIFHSNIAIVANALIVREGTTERCMRYDEFADFSFGQDNGKRLEPLRTIFMNFEAEQKPLFWLRLVAYCHLCNKLIESIGKEMGFQKRTLDIGERLQLTKDEEMLSNLQFYVHKCEVAAIAQL